MYNITQTVPSSEDFITRHWTMHYYYIITRLALVIHSYQQFGTCINVATLDTHNQLPLMFMLY